MNIRILFLCLLALLPQSARALSTNVEARVTFTNALGIVSGNTITINGDIRRVTNGVLNNAATWIQGTNSPGWAATNVWLHLGTYGVVGVDRIFPTNTSNIIIAGTYRTNTALSVSLSAGVGVVTYATNVWADTLPIQFPTGSLATEAGRTNNESGFFSVMNDVASRSTNYVENGIKALTNLLDRISQQIASNKVFYATTNNGGLIDGSRITNVVFATMSNGTLTAFQILGSTNSGWIGSVTNGNFWSNVMNFVRGTNLQALHGTVFILSNGTYVASTLTNPVTLNLVNYGNAIQSLGTGANSFQLGSNANATGTRAMAAGNNALSSGTDGLAAGNWATNLGANGTAVGGFSIVRAQSGTAVGYYADADELGTAIGTVSLAGTNATAVGRGAAATGYASGAFGDSSEASEAYSGAFMGAATKIFAIALGGVAQHSNSFVVGTQDHLSNIPVTTDTNQGVLGTALHRISIPGQLLISGSQSNTTFTGTNLWLGDLSAPWHDVSTLANGNNISVPFGTNILIRLSGTLTSTGTICGAIAGATSGGRNGQLQLLWNDTGSPVVIAQDTSDPIPSNRFALQSGNVFMPADTFAWIAYASTISRWKVVSLYPNTNLVAASTNAITSIQTNSAYVGNLLTNVQFTTGITGYLSGATAVLGVNIAPGSSTNALVQTNGVNVGSAGTVNWTTGVTGYLAGAVANLGVSASGSGGGLTTNANQFGGAPLSIIDGALFTNITVYTDLLVKNGSATNFESSGANLILLPASTQGGVFSIGTRGTTKGLSYDHSGNTFNIYGTAGTTKFNIAGSSGDTATAGALSATGAVYFGSTLTNAGAADVTGPLRTWAAVTNAGISYFTAWGGSKVLISGSDKSLGESLTTDTELSYLSGVTAPLQTQLSGKMAVTGGTNVLFANQTNRIPTGSAIASFKLQDTNGNTFFHFRTNQVMFHGTNQDGLYGSNSPIPGTYAMGVSNNAPMFTINGGNNSLSLGVASPSAGKALTAVDGTGLVAWSNAVSAVVNGWGDGSTISGGTLTVVHSNSVTLIASNATTAQVDFTTTPDYISTDVMRANLVLQLTNLVYGRSIGVYLTGDTNANNRTVTLSTNGFAGNLQIHWNFNSPTNGNSDFTVTNNMRAELQIKATKQDGLGTNHVWAVWGTER